MVTVCDQRAQGKVAAENKFVRAGISDPVAILRADPERVAAAFSGQVATIGPGGLEIDRTVQAKMAAVYSDPAATIDPGILGIDRIVQAKAAAASAGDRATTISPIVPIELTIAIVGIIGEKTTLPKSIITFATIGTTTIIGLTTTGGTTTGIPITTGTTTLTGGA